MDKTRVLWTKLWYYTENYKKKEEKMHIRLPNTKKL